jgi:acylphosphatase
VIRRRVVITGDVQGVFFRDSCRRLAVQQTVAGWVRNLPDGRVEAAFEGDSGGVDRLVAWSHDGPPEAIVDRVEVFDETPEGATSFQILPTPRY